MNADQARKITIVSGPDISDAIEEITKAAKENKTKVLFHKGNSAVKPPFALDYRETLISL